MSRIGKNPIDIPTGVTVDINGQEVKTKGKNGELGMVFSQDVSIVREEEQIVVSPRSNSTQSRKMWGTARAVIANMVTGVSEGFTRDLEVNGVGYRASMQGKTLVLQLGYSHDIIFSVPDSVEITCPDQTHIKVFGADKQRVGQVAAEIRSFRPPEPYKGKGIKYSGEYILRKEGKKK